MAKKQAEPAASDESGNLYVWTGTGNLALHGVEGKAKLEPGVPKALTPSQQARGLGLMKEGRLLTLEAWRKQQARERGEVHRVTGVAKLGRAPPMKPSNSGKLMDSPHSGKLEDSVGENKPAVIVAAGKVELPSGAGVKKPAPSKSVVKPSEG